MKRITILIAAAMLVAALSAASASAKSGRATLKLRQTSAGKILVNGRGYTLYAFTKDRRNKDRCNKACLSVWPAVTTVGKPHLGRGVKASLVATIKLKHGGRQVTYNGHPLYTYIADTHPAQTSFINIFQFGGRWPAMNAAGREVTKK